jgi:hypothetical protein
MELKKLELLVRRIELDGTETHLAVRAEYEPKPVQSGELEHCRKYFPHIYQLIERIDGAPYERL